MLPWFWLFRDEGKTVGEYKLAFFLSFLKFVDTSSTRYISYIVCQLSFGSCFEILDQA